MSAAAEDLWFNLGEGIVGGITAILIFTAFPFVINNPSTNSNHSYITTFNDSGGTSGTKTFLVRINGNCQNANNSYGVLGMSSNHDLQIRTN